MLWSQVRLNWRQCCGQAVEPATACRWHDVRSPRLTAYKTSLATPYRPCVVLYPHDVHFLGRPLMVAKTPTPPPTVWFGLKRCPHCQIAVPNFFQEHTHEIRNTTMRLTILRCFSCDLCTMVVSHFNGAPVRVWPEPKTYSQDIPQRARRSLEDARAALATPSLSIVGSAAAVDWMLKEKGYKEGKLYGRIEKAAAEHLITPDMKDWAHEVRLEANNERHADDELPEPTLQDAERVLSFAEALAELLFELPARVARGRGKEQAAEEPEVGSRASGGAGAFRPLSRLNAF